MVGRWKDKPPLRHVWQQDLGFRASRARNLGAAANCSDYIIWIDGDCLLPSNFIEKHVALSKPKHLIAGGRRLLSEEFTARMFTQNVAVDQAFDSWKFISFPLGYFRSIQSKSWNIVRSCNLSLYRDDLIEIGGFDESFVGWGREDSDFVIRLMNLGLKIKSGRLATCVAHLYHYDRSKSHLSINDERLARTLDSARIYSQRSILEDNEGIGVYLLRNALINGYPFEESIRSILPIVDEFICVVGESVDETRKRVARYWRSQNKIVDSWWNESMTDRGFVYGQQKMIAQYNCTGDWAFYLEGDEVFTRDGA